MSFSVVIVGGGVMGAATACFLAREHGAGVTVLERDPHYARASSALSASSIRMQFSQPVNIRLSAWSLGFLRRAGPELAVAGERPHIGLVEPGYLYLANSTAGSHLLRENQAVQAAAGAEVNLLDPAQLRERFAWLNVADLELGAHGPSTAGSGEGWFDGPALHQAFRRKAQSLGVRFLHAECERWETSAGRIVAALAHEGTRHEADAFVLAAGAWSAPLAAAIGVELPVAPKKRDVFVFESPARLAGCPLVIDPGGLWFRPEGSRFLCGGPPRGDDPDEPPLHAIDHGLFEEVLWPALAHRVPAFEALRQTAAWSGYYEMNTFDHNGLAGALPGWSNAYAACGFSGHGMQQAPAVGAALAALVAGRPSAGLPSIEALDPSRVLRGEPLLERNVI